MIKIAGDLGCLAETLGRQKEIALFLMPKVITSLKNMAEMRGLIPNTDKANMAVLMMAVTLLGVLGKNSGREGMVKPSMEKILGYLWN